MLREFSALLQARYLASVRGKRPAKSSTSAGTPARRRLCRARVVGIQGAVDRHELYAEAVAETWLSRRDTFERALAEFEAGRWADACRTMVPLLSSQEGNYDVPSLDPLTRAVGGLKSPPESFDPVVELASK